MPQVDKFEVQRPARVKGEVVGALGGVEVHYQHSGKPKVPEHSGKFHMFPELSEVQARIQATKKFRDFFPPLNY